MIVDCHMHTALCGHAHGTAEAYVEAAAARGIGLVTFTCHIPIDRIEWGGPGIRMRRKELDAYRARVARAAERGRELGVEVLCGIESELWGGAEVRALVEEVLCAHHWDFVLGSLHASLPVYRSRLDALGLYDDGAIAERYFADLAEWAALSRCHSLSHLDVVRLYGVVEEFDASRHETSVRRVLATAREKGLCIEVNTSGLIKQLPRLHPDPIILRWAHEEGVPLTIGSDAHRPDQVGQHYGSVLPLLRSIGFEALHYFRGGVRQAVALG